MKLYILYNADGSIAQAECCESPLVIPEGMSLLELPSETPKPDTATHYVAITSATDASTGLTTVTAVLNEYTQAQKDKLLTVPPMGFKWDAQLGDFIDTRAKAKVQEDVWEAIKTKRDKRKFGGVKTQVGLAADGTTPVYKWFHSDDGSRLQQMGLVMMGTGIPAGLMWKTMDGTFVEMTSTIAKAVFDAVAAHDTSTFKTAEDHKAAMLAAADPAKYDFSTGWSPIYGE